jgi:hypothetical protein
MTFRCPNCRLEIDAKQIVALESWKDDQSEVVRDVVLVCPGCNKRLAPPSREPADSRALSS